MFCLIKDNDFFIRADEWSDKESFIWKCNKITTFGNNEYFNIDKAYTCPKNCEAEDLSQLKFFKECQDDICPVALEKTDLGGNHAYDCVDVVIMQDHGKTEADIGSVWKDISGKEFCLVKVPDQNTLWFVCLPDMQYEECGSMTPGCPDSVFQHERGASNISKIVIEKRTSTQLWRCFNHYTLELWADEKEIDITRNQLLTAEKFSFVTKYDVIYVPAMLQYLIEHAGKNTNSSHYSDAIQECYFRMEVTYTFYRNASYTVYTNHIFSKDVKLKYIGLIQSISLEGRTYIYVPDTSYEVLTEQEIKDVKVIGRDIWKDAEKAPYRYYQFAESEEGSKKGMALVFDQSCKHGRNALRIRQMTDAGCYSNVRKMYPAFISGGNIYKGSVISGLGAVMPLNSFDSELTSVCWYWSGEDIILMIDTHHAVNKKISLPDYMNGADIEILDKTEHCIMKQNCISECCVEIETDGYGYFVLKLKKKQKGNQKNK